MFLNQNPKLFILADHKISKITLIAMFIPRSVKCSDSVPEIKYLQRTEV